VRTHGNQLTAAANVLEVVQATRKEERRMGIDDISRWNNKRGRLSYRFYAHDSEFR